jgi:hypothetical protein
LFLFDSRPVSYSIHADADADKKNSVADPDGDPGYGGFLTPGSGMRVRDSGWNKNPNTGSGMNIPDNFSQSLETVFRVKNT